jgi:hypothetical protein
MTSLRLLHRGDQMWVFHEHKRGSRVVVTHDCLSQYARPLLLKRAACFSARKPFCGALFAEGGGRFILFYTRLPVAALIKILLFGAITHHAGMRDLGLLLGVRRDRDFIRHIKYSVRQALFKNWGTRLSSGKPRLVRKVMAVQNCSMKGLPMRLL